MVTAHEWFSGVTDLVGVRPRCFTDIRHATTHVLRQRVYKHCIVVEAAVEWELRAVIVGTLRRFFRFVA